jgi:pectate lyase
MQRMLADRFGPCHMYNNYWDCAGNDYCTAARNVTQMLSENNYYDGVKDPLTKEQSGKLKTVGNTFHNCTGKQVTSSDSVFTPSYGYTLDATANVPARVKSGAGNR